MINNEKNEETHFDLNAYYKQVIGFYKNQLDLVMFIEDKNHDEYYYELIVLQYATYAIELLESIFVQTSSNKIMVTDVLLRSLFEYFITLEYIKKDKINHSRQYFAYSFKQRKTFRNVLRNKNLGLSEEEYERFDKEIEEAYKFFGDDIDKWSKRSLEQRALKCGLKDMYDLLYRNTSSIAHPTPLSLLSFYKEPIDNKLIINDNNSQNDSNLELGILHCNFIMESFNKQFQLPAEHRYEEINAIVDKFKSKE